MLIDIRAKLVMWDKVMLPESVKGEDGKYQKTGNKVESTNYVFRDIDGSKLVFMSNNATYRTYEGKDVEVQCELTYDEFNKKNKIQLKTVSLI